MQADLAMINRIVPGIYSIEVSENEFEYILFNPDECGILLLINPLEVSVVSNIALELYSENGCKRLGVVVSYPSPGVVNAVNSLQHTIPSMLTITSSELGAMLREGKCADSPCPPINVSWEVKGKSVELDEGIFVFKLNTPIAGTIGVLFRGVLLAYELHSTPFGTTRYICTSKNCIKK